MSKNAGLISLRSADHERYGYLSGDVTRDNRRRTGIGIVLTILCRKLKRNKKEKANRESTLLVIVTINRIVDDSELNIIFSLKR